MLSGTYSRDKWVDCYHAKVTWNPLSHWCALVRLFYTRITTRPEMLARTYFLINHWAIFCNPKATWKSFSHSHSHIARRHGHVFRMALHNEGDWRMETWQRARRASCHVSIRQSPSCVIPFWTHAKCLLAFISYLPMWIKAKYTFIITRVAPWGPDRRK